MGNTLRKRWDVVNDCASTKRQSLAEHERAWKQANDAPIPEFRAKLVRLPHGQTEISVTPVNRERVINARMGFNPLLDCPRVERSSDEQLLRDNENRARAAKRAKQNVRFLIKSINADHLLTFTYRENVLDRAKCAKDWKEFVRLFRIRYPAWQYVAALEEQERGSIHFHVAVIGKQDIKWLLRCWLIAIGQPVHEVNDWYIRAVPLGAKSFGSVNVTAPNKRWGSGGNKWKANKLSGYLTKYIGKEFHESDKFAKKYWHSRNIIKPVIERFWLHAITYEQAIIEAHDLIYFSGATSISMWNDAAAQVVWITGETAREKLGHCVSVPHNSAEFDFLNED